MMDRQDYEQKILLLLDDYPHIQEASQGSIAVFGEEDECMLLELKRKGSISEQLYSRFCSSAGRTPPLYGLPKIHKEDIPLRPIASFVHSPAYQQWM